MPDDPSVAAIHARAFKEMLELPKLYGPNGFANFLSRSVGGANGSNDGPPAGLVAALEQLETATVDPALLTGGQTVASVEAQTIKDLADLAFLTDIVWGAASSASTLTPGESIRIGSLLRSYDFNRLPADAKLFTPAAAKPPLTLVDPPPPPASGAEQFLVTDLTTGVSDWEDGQVYDSQLYDGPVAGPRNLFITITRDNVNITATKGSSFIHTGSGNNGVDVGHLAAVVGGGSVVDGLCG